MAAPTYASDLQTVIADPTTSTGWSALGGGASGLATAGETDYYVQGSSCMSKGAWQSALKGMLYNNGSGISVAAGDAIWIWMTHHTPASLAAETSGGLRLTAGNATSAYKEWYIRGSDTISYGAPWVCAVVDPTVTQDNQVGSPNGTLQYLGGQANLPSGGPTKGSPFGIDAIRYGRTFTITNGDIGNGYATFAGAVAYNDNNARVYGQIEQGLGTYIARGRLRLGSSGTPVDFRDSNRNVLFDRLTKVGSTFNEIEVVNASSRVDWTGINLSQLLGTPQTATRVRFLMTDNADVNIDGCAFADMGAFTFQNNAAVIDSAFRRCDLITAGGAVFDGCLFSNTNDATRAVTASSPAAAALISGSQFVSSGTKHGLEITGTADNMTLTNVTWTGYAGSDGSTGNEAIYVNIATGSMNITVSGGTTPSIRTAGCAVTVISGAVTVIAKAITEDGSNLDNARVHLEAAAGGPFPANASVTITNSGTTATVTHTSHGLATNDKVVIRGASHIENNGVFTITVTGANSYTYTMGSAPGSDPTGTITSTFVVLNGLTNASGEISMSRVFPSNQPATGRIRKSTSAPYYKNATIVGTVSSSTGATLTGVMISDD